MAIPINEATAGMMWERVGDQRAADYNAVDWDSIVEVIGHQGHEGKTERARTLMFVQVMYRRYGRTIRMNTVVAHAANMNANLHTVAYSSPTEMDAFLSNTSTIQLAPTANPPLNPHPALAGGALLAWDCMNVFRGKFSWNGGRNAAFFAWLNANSALAPANMGIIPADAQISCWEVVFYAMIKTANLPIVNVLNAYNVRGISTAAACYNMLVNYLNAMVPARAVQEILFLDPGYDNTVLQIGDIILCPTNDVVLAQATAKDYGTFMDHVLVVVAPSPLGAVDETAVFHLWGLFGSGFADIIKLKRAIQFQYKDFPDRPRFLLLRML